MAMLVIYVSIPLGTGGFCNLILDMVCFFIWDYFLHYIHGRSPPERRVENTDNCTRAQASSGSVSLAGERELCSTKKRAFALQYKIQYKETREHEECSYSTHGSRVCGDQN